MNTYFAQQLLSWYDQYGRKDLPWQTNKSPYRVWVSEIMLQQTQVKTVIPYYQQFMQRFPTLQLLAEADQDEVLQLWTGLGYYARARNLHKTAKIINNENCAFPNTLEALQKLPGIGRSTAGAILSLTDQQRQPILDGNVKRILSRYFLVEGWSGKTAVLNELWEFAEKVTPVHRHNDFNQALMDLGSSLCSRTKPDCCSCPLKQNCKAWQMKLTEDYPAPRPRKKLPEKSAHLLILTNLENKVLFEQRPPYGLWGGLWTFPEFSQSSDILHWLEQHQLIALSDMQKWPSFRHTFSHYHLNIHPLHLQVKTDNFIMDRDDLIWWDIKKPLKFGVPAPISKLVSRLLKL